LAVSLLHATVGAAEVWCSGHADGNVGDHVGDDPAAVARHRSAVAMAAGLADPAAWVWLRQVHGRQVVEVAAPPPAQPEADASLTGARGLPLAIVTADCAPVVLANDDAVAAVHAGHRGLLAGVLENAVAHLRTRGAGPVRAFLGPCIHAECYEFGEADLEPLVARLGAQVASTTTDGRPALDIPAAVRAALARVEVDGLDDCGVCTSHAPGYFSYRRDGVTGRQVTVAVLR
jgi:YfiH family protein